jgi:hypothetical protein
VNGGFLGIHLGYQDVMLAQAGGKFQVFFGVGTSVVGVGIEAALRFSQKGGRQSMGRTFPSAKGEK